MVEERSRGFICLFIFFFVSLFFDKFSKFSSKSAKIVARTRANVNEDRRDPRDTLPFSQQPHVYHPRLSLGLLLLLSMRIFNIFPSRLFIYFIFFYLEFHVTLDFFFFPHQARQFSSVAFLCGAAKQQQGVDSRGSCSTACQQSGVRVIRKKTYHFNYLILIYKSRDHAPFRRGNFCRASQGAISM